MNKKILLLGGLAVIGAAGVVWYLTQSPQKPLNSQTNPYDAGLGWKGAGWYAWGGNYVTNISNQTDYNSYVQGGFATDAEIPNPTVTGTSPNTIPTITTGLTNPTTTPTTTVTTTPTPAQVNSAVAAAQAGGGSSNVQTSNAMANVQVLLANVALTNQANAVAAQTAGTTPYALSTSGQALLDSLNNQISYFNSTVGKINNDIALAGTTNSTMTYDISIYTSDAMALTAILNQLTNATSSATEAAAIAAASQWSQNNGIPL